MAFSGLTAWAKRGDTPLRTFLRTETGSATVLAAATVAALIWANISSADYSSFWATAISVHVGHWQVRLNLRDFVNSGLMAFFFLVVGLEARREYDVGELRVRSRMLLPLAAGLGGMLVPICIFLAVNAGRHTAHGWGMAMSTDTAFALGALALTGRGLPDRVRTYLLTFSVVDDLAGIAVIAIAYSGTVRFDALFVGIGLLGAVVVVKLRHVRSGPIYFLLALAAWVAFWQSGVDPIVVGLVMGLMSVAAPASRTTLEEATEAFREFREQPTAVLARAARRAGRLAVSPNERLEALYHPWSSYVIVPLFALANAGVALSPSFLAHAYMQPVTIGIMAGYLIGKPLGTFTVARVVCRVTHRRVVPPVGWGAVLGTGTVAGIGFTVSLLIASRALSGATLAEAKLGILTTTVGATFLTWLVFRVIHSLPIQAKLRLLLGTSEVITDLMVPVDDSRDHVRGPSEASVTIVEYGDFECPYCGQAEPSVRELLRDRGDIRYVFRHLPLTDVHPHAQLAAEAAEAASLQDKFWEMHDLLYDNQDALTFRDLIGYATRLELDIDRFMADLRGHTGAGQIASDVDSADLSNVSGTPTFFVNGIRHYGAYDIDSLTAAVKAAHARTKIEALRFWLVKKIALSALIALFLSCGFPAAAHAGVRYYGPWRVSIPAIGVNADIVGMSRPPGHFHYLPVPSLSSSWLVGWYNFSARPGDRGDTVLVGHVDTYRGPAVFYNLYRLRPGSPIYLTTAPGHTVRYRVRWVKELSKQRFPVAAVFGPTNSRRLWLITCGGSFNYATRSYLDNIIVSAGRLGRPASTGVENETHLCSHASNGIGRRDYGGLDACLRGDVSPTHDRAGPGSPRGPGRDHRDVPDGGTPDHRRVDAAYRRGRKAEPSAAGSGPSRYPAAADHVRSLASMRQGQPCRLDNHRHAGRQVSCTRPHADTAAVRLHAESGGEDRLRWLGLVRGHPPPGGVDRL